MGGSNGYDGTFGKSPTVTLTAEVMDHHGAKTGGFKKTFGWLDGGEHQVCLYVWGADRAGPSEVVGKAGWRAYRRRAWTLERQHVNITSSHEMNDQALYAKRKIKTI